MKDVVRHLIKKYSYTKIAFVSGHKKHLYAEQRYKAYIDVVKENNELQGLCPQKLRLSCSLYKGLMNIKLRMMEI